MGLVLAVARRLGLVSHLTPAQQDLLRRALAASGGRLNNTAAPGCDPGAAEPNGRKEPTDMSSISRRAHELRPGDIITNHPDHPTQTVHYRVQTWPKSLGDGNVLIDYTATSVRRADGSVIVSPATGVLVLNAGQPCQIDQYSHFAGGAK